MESVMGNIKLHTGQLMPAVGLGTWQGSGEAVKKAIDVGYRHIDTAQNYENEDQVGEALQQKIQEGKIRREDIFITTKLSMEGMAPSNVGKETELSLKRLKTDYIDLFLIHFPVPLSDEKLDESPPGRWPAYGNGALKTSYVDPLDTWREMEKLVDDGLVKAIGLSNFNKEQIERICELSRIKPANLQVEIHAWLPQQELVELCKERNISVTAYAPLGSPGKPAALNLGPETTRLLDEMLIKDIADKYKKTPAQVLLRNLIQRDIIVIPKSESAERIRSNLKVMDFELSKSDMEAIEGLDKNLRLFTWALFGTQNYSHPFFPWPEEFAKVLSGTSI